MTVRPWHLTPALRESTERCTFQTACETVASVKSNGAARAGAAAFCYVDAAQHEDGTDRSQQQLRRHEEPLAELQVHHACVLCCDGDGAAPLPAAKLAAGCASCRDLHAAACALVSDDGTHPAQPTTISFICGLVLASWTTAVEVAPALYVTRCIVCMVKPFEITAGAR